MKLYFYKVDMGNFFWHLMSYREYKTWPKYPNCAVLGLTYDCPSADVDKAKGPVHSLIWKGRSWQNEASQGCIEESNALEILVLYGYSVDTIRRCLESRKL